MISTLLAVGAGAALLTAGASRQIVHHGLHITDGAAGGEHRGVVEPTAGTSPAAGQISRSASLSGLSISLFT
jgi:hypothetical protein